MAKRISYVTLQSGGVSTSSTAYVLSSSACGWTYTAANYDATVTCRLEIIGSVDNASYTLYSRLYVDGAPGPTNLAYVSTTNVTLYKSTEFTPTDGKTYIPRIKVSNAAATGTPTLIRIAIIEDGISAKTETQVRIAGSGTTTNTTGVDCAALGLWTYTASEWGGTVTAYFESVLNTNNASGTASAWLSDDSNNLVTNSTVTNTTSTADPTPKRSVAITLVDGTTYKARMKTNNASYTTTARMSRVIIVQTTTATPTVSYVDLTNGQVTSTSTTGTSLAKPYSHVDADFTGLTFTPQLTGTLSTNNASYTATLTLEAGTVGSVGTTSTTAANVIDTTVTLADATDYYGQIKIANAAATATLSSAKMKYLLTSSSSSIKTVMNLAKASVKTVNDLAIASVKTINGLT